MSNLIVVLLALLWMVVAMGAGRSLLCFFQIESRCRIEILLISFLLGFALISYLILGMGLVGWLSPAMVWSVFVLLLLAGTSTWKYLIPKRRRQLTVNHYEKQWRFWQDHWVVSVLAGFVAISSVLNLIACFAPPSEGDSLSYHLAIPAYYIMQQQIIFQPFYITWGLPLTAEMWNTLGLLMGSNQLPQIFQWVMGIAGATCLYLFVSQKTTKRTGLFVAALYYLLPQITYLSTSAKSDLAWMAFLLMSIHTLFAWKERDEKGWLWLSAIFTGLTLATKYQGLFWAVSIGTTLVVMQWKDWRSFPLKVLSKTFVYVGIAVLVVSPWYLRNWLATGDPIWPYGFSFFHSQYWTQELHDKYASWQQGPGASIWHYIIGLWNMTVNQSAWLLGLRIPYLPIQLAFIPGLIFMLRDVPVSVRRFFCLLLVTVAVYYTCWFCNYQVLRYSLPVMTLLLIPSAYVFWEILSFSWSRWTAMFILLATLLFSASYNIAFNSKFFPVVFGMENKDSFLAHKVSFYNDIVWVNQNLPEDSRVLFFLLNPFYLERDYIIGGSYFWQISEHTTSEEYLCQLKEKAVTHIFITGCRDDNTLSAFIIRLVEPLRQQGYLTSIYFNPVGSRVISRTLGEKEVVPVEILKITNP